MVEAYGSSPEKILSLVKDVHAIAVRSETKITREVIAAAPTVPMYQRVAHVPASEIQKLSDTVLGALASAESDMANHRRLLRWFIEQFRGEPRMFGVELRAQY